MAAASIIILHYFYLPIISTFNINRKSINLPINININYEILPIYFISSFILVFSYKMKYAFT